MKKQEVFETINKQRISKGITKQKLAELTGVEQSTLSRNMSQQTRMTLDTFLRIDDVLDLGMELKAKDN